MNNDLHCLLLKLLARECDFNPHNTLRENWNSSRRKAEEDGFPIDYLNSIDFEIDIQPFFLHRSLPNPLYWDKVFKQHIVFFLIRSMSKRYLSLLKILKEKTPDITYFVCYGEVDVIVRFMGDQSMIEDMENILSNHGFQPSTIQVEDILCFYDQNKQIDETYSVPKVEPGVVDQILSFSPEEIPVQQLEELKRCGVILNNVFYEDTHKTGRIRAFIGIKLNLLPSKSQISNIEKAIANINDSEYRRRKSRPISSIYKCMQYFAYLLEVICDDQEQLDYITDLIQNIDPCIGDTETIVLAKAEFLPFSFSKKLIGELSEYTIVQSIIDERIIPLSKSLLIEFPKIKPQYLHAKSEDQFRVITLFNEFIFTRELKIDPLILERIEENICDFFLGILQSNIKTIQNSGIGLIRDVVEEEHRILVQSIVENLLNNDAKKLQGILKSSNAKWTNWGLSAWGGHLYVEWNQNCVYGSVFKVPTTILNDLNYIGGMRNVLVHKANLDDIDKLISQLREVFLRSFNILIWIVNVKEVVCDPKISLDDLRNILQTCEVNQYNQLDNIYVRQDEIKELITKIYSQSDQQWTAIGDLLKSMSTTLERVDKNSVLQMEELVLPKLNQKDRSKAEVVMQYLKETAIALPNKVVVSIMASLILQALGL